MNLDTLINLFTLLFTHLFTQAAGGVACCGSR
jgi:hypothetical protein